MAERELSVRYRTVIGRVGFPVMCVFMPVWALLAPILLGLFIGHVGRNPETISSIWTALICATIVLVMFAGLILTAITEDDRIYVSKDGLAFPLFMLPFLKFKRNRSWSEVRAADLSLKGDGTPILQLTFDTLVVPVDLSLIDDSEREQMLISIELWGKNCSRSPALIEYQNNLQDSIRGLDKLTYTQMWEEELGRRFTATSFVPLEPEAMLKDGKLRVVKQLAFGGLSAIYEAQKDGIEIVVLKEAVIPANAEPKERASAEERIWKESQILMKLSHPGITKVLDYFVEEGRHYLCLEYVSGQDLRQLIKQNGPQDEEKVLDWAEQIGNICQYLHGQEIPVIHRDLTPDNLVLRKDGSITLIDFGAANEFLGQATGTLVGKQAYMAPEQLRGKANTRSDLYSLGGTLFYLLTGRDPKPLMASEPKSVLPGLGDFTNELVKGLTAFEEGERIQSADEMVRRLNERRSSEVTVQSSEL